MRIASVLFLSCVCGGCLASPPASPAGAPEPEPDATSDGPGDVSEPADAAESRVDSASGDTASGDAGRDATALDSSFDVGGDMADGGPDALKGDDAGLRTRIPLTINSGAVTQDLADFPLLVDVRHDEIAARLTADTRRDVAFSSANQVPLSYELEAVDPAAGTVRAWVLVPLVSATQDTVVYLEFDARTNDSASVWQSYGGVWHFAPLTQNRDVYRDSTANDNDGTPIADAPTSLGGKVGPALQLNGTDQWVQVARDPSLEPQTFTVSAWVNLEDKGGGVGPISKPLAIDNWNSWQIWVTSQLEFLTWVVPDGQPTAETGGAFAPNSWTHLAYTFDGNDVVHYVDGVETHRFTVPGTPDYDDSPIYIGADVDYGAVKGWVLGLIDEARVASEPFSGARIAAEFANQDDPGSFVEVGTPESY